MKAVNVSVTLVIVLVALYCTVWFGRSATRQTVEDGPPPVGADVPTLTKIGPLPKAVIPDGRLHNFGTMIHGQKGKHVFTIRNDGKGTLRLVARPEDTTCQCTVGRVSKNEVAPGETAEIELHWEIKNPNAEFEHSAIVRTNDSEMVDIKFIIQGKVRNEFIKAPTDEWRLGAIRDQQATEFTGTIYSEVHTDFTFTKIQSKNPLITFETRPLTTDELFELHDDPLKGMTLEGLDAKQIAVLKERMTPEPKCGYSVKVTIAPGLPVGPFREELTFHTNLEPEKKVTVYVSGNRAGPVQFFGGPGVQWYGKLALLRLGSFAASEGKKTKLTMFIRNIEQPMKVLKVEIQPEFIKLAVERNEKFSGQNTHQYFLHLEVPAGSPAAQHQAPDTAKVVLTTDHPDAKSIQFSVEFISR